MLRAVAARAHRRVVPGGGPMRGRGSNRWTRSPRERRPAALIAELAVMAVGAALFSAIACAGSTAAAATSCPAAGCALTVDARDYPTGNPLANFTYLVNKDNTKLASDPLALSTESNSPVLAEGDQDRATVTLPAG